MHDDGKQQVTEGANKYMHILTTHNWGYEVLVVWFAGTFQLHLDYDP